MRHPFFNMTRVNLDEGDVDFHVLDGREGLVVTLGPDAIIFDRPGRSVSRWSGVTNLLGKSPHEIRKRSFLAREINFLSWILWGGGDVKFNCIQSVKKQREILITAGEGSVVEKIDLYDLEKQKIRRLFFLQPAYLCSSQGVEITAQFCDPSLMSWARAPYVYVANLRDRCTGQAILCLSGRTMVWSERLEPGERRLISVGNVIAVSENITCSIQPTNLENDEDDDEGRKSRASPELSPAQDVISEGSSSPSRRQKVKDFSSSIRILFNSIKSREGVLVCELVNQSDSLGLVYTQLNKTSFYGGSGLIGVLIRMISSFVRWGDAASGY